MKDGCKWMCGICKETFVEHGDLRTHIDTKHPEELLAIEYISKLYKLRTKRELDEEQRARSEGSRA